MKTIQTYKGMKIMQLGKKDVGTETWKIGDIKVFNQDGDEEYDSIGSIEEAKEKIDGLLLDRKRK